MAQRESRQVPNPVFGPNRFKLGLFNANCDGGFAISKAPERWAANWDDIVKISLWADAAGIDFILPVAKWRGLGGEADNLGRSYETMTHSAAIGALTKRIGMFVTVHAPVLTPAYVAKCLATIDAATHGRVGLNIVCGWNQNEFDVHGIEIDGEHRYDHGLEWWKVLSKMLEGGKPFDWNGQYFKLKNAVTDPLPLQKKIPVMSAGFSYKGRDFAGQAADLLFTSVSTIERAPAIVQSVHDYAKKYDREIQVFTSSHIVCRPTRQEAEDFYYYFAETMADRACLEQMTAMKKKTAGSDTPEKERADFNPEVHTRYRGKIYPGSFPGSYTFVGTPDDIVEEMVLLEKAGLRGAAITFLDYVKDMPFFNQEVLPRMERAGLREKVKELA